jgi:glycine hydroxymethyltransferase
LENTKFLCEELKKKGFSIVSNETDNHLFLIDLAKQNIDGRTASELLEKVGIITNANTVPNDKLTPWRPQGLRIGLSLETTKGINKTELKKIANIFYRELILRNKHSPKSLK